MTLGYFKVIRRLLVDNENAETVLGGKDRMSRFNHQMRFVRAGLQKSEAMVLPPCAVLILFCMDDN